MTEKRPLPHSVQAEQCVIGMCIGTDEWRDQLISMVSPEMFHSPRHRALWQLILQMVQDQQTIEMTSLYEYASTSNKLEQVGDAAGIAEVCEFVTSTPVFYAKQIKRYYLLRQLISLGRQISESAYDPEADCDEVMSNANDALIDLMTTGTTTSEVTLGESTQVVLESIEERIKTRGVAGVETGFSEIDGLVGGLKPGQLVVLAARPAVGKSALVLNIAHHVAASAGPTLFVSLEMAHSEQTERILSYESGIVSKSLQHAELTHGDRDNLFGAVEKVQNVPLMFLDNTFELGAIVSKSRAIYRQRGLKLIVVDYLQLCEVKGVPESQRQSAVAKISRSLKQLAQQLQIPVIALSQLNRELEKRQDKRPMLSDLRESGAIEQDANVVMFLHRPDVFDSDDRPGEADLIVAKNRSGDTGVAALSFRRELTKFEEPAVYGGAL